MPSFQRKAAPIYCMTVSDLELKEVMYRGKNSHDRYDGRDACVHTACLGQCVCLAWQEGVSWVNECCMNCRETKNPHTKLSVSTRRSALFSPTQIQSPTCQQTFPAWEHGVP